MLSAQITTVMEIIPSLPQVQGEGDYGDEWPPSKKLVTQQTTQQSIKSAMFLLSAARGVWFMSGTLKGPGRQRFSSDLHNPAGLAGF